MYAHNYHVTCYIACKQKHAVVCPLNPAHAQYMEISPKTVQIIGYLIINTDTAEGIGSKQWCLLLVMSV